MVLKKMVDSPFTLSDLPQSGSGAYGLVCGWSAQQYNPSSCLFRDIDGDLAHQICNKMEFSGYSLGEGSTYMLIG